ncbi:MAG: lipopolysaccharide biosynthesis protein [Mucilaginibacter sp.]
MSQANNEINDIQIHEISLKEIILKIKELWAYIFSKWHIVFIASIIGAVIAVMYAWNTQPIYKAQLSFTLQDDQGGGGGVSGALGLASQFGINLGSGGASGQFSGENLPELMKSRSIIEKTLLQPVLYKGKQQTLAEFYINFNKLRDDWSNKPELKNLGYPLNQDRSKFTLKQDSVLGAFYKQIIDNNLNIDKLDKKLSIITITVKSKNELFSKYFVEVLARVVSDFYIQNKTEKAVKNVRILQRQTDSVRLALYNNLSGVASSLDAAPNANPLLQTLRVPSQRKQVDVQANTAILTQLAANLEISRMALLQQTPLIQVIDKPILPLEKEKIGRLKALITGGFLAAFLTIIALLINKVYKEIMFDNA